MTPEQERVQAHFRRLKLHRMEQVLDHVAEESIKAPCSYTEFLARLLEAEVEARYERTTLSRIRLARFPFTKTLADFDCSFQPSIDQKKLKELAKLRFIEHGENVVCLGPPGVGNPQPINHRSQRKRLAGADRHHHRPSAPTLWADAPSERYPPHPLPGARLCGVAAPGWGTPRPRRRDRSGISPQRPAPSSLVPRV